MQLMLSSYPHVSWPAFLACYNVRIRTIVDVTDRIS